MFTVNEGKTLPRVSLCHQVLANMPTSNTNITNFESKSNTAVPLLEWHLDYLSVGLVCGMDACVFTSHP
jgi:hypothetical protein